MDPWSLAEKQAYTARFSARPRRWGCVRRSIRRASLTQCSPGRGKRCRRRGSAAAAGETLPAQGKRCRRGGSAAAAGETLPPQGKRCRRRETLPAQGNAARARKRCPRRETLPAEGNAARGGETLAARGTSLRPVSTSAPAGESSITLGARALSKRYGARTALHRVGFEVRAGKTALLSILAGILAPDEGELTTGSARIGWVPQQPALYSRLSVAENLRLFARLERLPDPELAVARMLAQTELEERRDDQVGRLSAGNRQRVNIAVGLLSEPSVLLLDEPSAALDPRQRERLWAFIAGLAEGGTTIVFSTHNVAEVERYGTRVLVLVPP